jgi:hypothetical protein
MGESKEVWTIVLESQTEPTFSVTVRTFRDKARMAKVWRELVEAIDAPSGAEGWEIDPRTDSPTTEQVASAPEEGDEGDFFLSMNDPSGWTGGFEEKLRKLGWGFVPEGLGLNILFTKTKLE